MDAGTLFWILLIGGGVLAMFFMHRGGHAHGRLGGGGGCGGHGHDHGGTSTDKQQEQRLEEDKKPSQGKHGSHDPDDEPATATSGHKHRGC